jgi:tetratricopeptide (TPR) repeat protein
MHPVEVISSGFHDKKDIFLKILPDEDREDLEKESTFDKAEACEILEKTFLDGLFSYKTFKLSGELKKRKGEQLNNLISNIINLLNDGDAKDKLNSLIDSLPFYILARIIDILPYKESVNYFSLIRERNFFELKPHIPFPYFEKSIEYGEIDKKLLETSVEIKKPSFSNFIFKSLLSFFSKDFNFHINEGRMEFVLNNYNQSFSYLSKAVKLNPEDFYANWYFSRLLYILGKRDDARKYYKKALSLEPFLDQYHFLTSLSLKENGEFSSSLEEARMLTELDSDYPYGLKLMGHIYMINCMYEEAVFYFNRALNLLKDDRDSSMELVEAYSQNEEYDKAKELALKSIEETEELSRKVKLLFKLGEMCKELEDIENARIYYEKSLELNKDYFPAINALAMVEKTSGNIEKAKELLEKAVTMMPEIPWIRKSLCEIYLEEDNTEMVKIHLQAILNVNPRDFYAQPKMKELSSQN